MSDMRTGEMTPYEQAVWQQINLQWADKHHGLIAGLRDGSMVAVPVILIQRLVQHAWAADYGDDWIGAGVREEACNAAEAMLAAAQEPQHDR